MSKEESPEYARLHWLRPEIGYYDVEEAKKEFWKATNGYPELALDKIIEWGEKWLGREEHAQV